MDKLDQALEMTFPASDPIAVGSATSTEPLQHPSGRDAGAPNGPPVQGWIRLCLLPWAMWAAFGLMLTSWPLQQAGRLARQISERNDTHLNS